MRARDFDRETFLLETWPNALESGEFKQCQGRLLVIDEYTGQREYCCLGVACKLLTDLKLLPRNAWEDERSLPTKAQTLLGIDELGTYNSSGDDLAEANDKGRSFKQIAKTIRNAVKRKQFVPPASDQD